MKGSNSSQTIQAFGCAPTNESKIVLPHVRGDHGQKGVSLPPNRFSHVYSTRGCCI